MQARLMGGELDSFQWEVPQEAPGATQELSGESSTALVPVAALQAAQALMLDAQQRERELRDQLQQRDRELQQLQRELGKVEGELGALKAKPRSWWARMFGGE
jgi:hypothetical protein